MAVLYTPDYSLESPEASWSLKDSYTSPNVSYVFWSHLNFWMGCCMLFLYSFTCSILKSLTTILLAIKKQILTFLSPLTHLLLSLVLFLSLCLCLGRRDSLFSHTQNEYFAFPIPACIKVFGLVGGGWNRNSEMRDKVDFVGILHLFQSSCFTLFHKF